MVTYFVSNRFFRSDFPTRFFSHMTFDILSAATTVGHQKAHHSLLNSNISKLIHDQGKLPCTNHQGIHKYFNQNEA